MANQLTTGQQANVVLGWYDGGTIDAAQAEQIIRILENGLPTVDCVPFDQVRTSIAFSEEMRAFTTDQLLAFSEEMKTREGAGS